ncbi:MAG: hypothetical protein QXO00_04130 [Candidatus Bathyarchaeia archaeon]
MDCSDCIYYTDRGECSRRWSREGERFCYFFDSAETLREIIFCEEVLKADSDFAGGVFKGYNPVRLEYIRRALVKYGRTWIIAAMVDGSIGYHTFQSAENVLECVLNNWFTVCERTMALYHCDASLEVASDIFRFERLFRENPEKAKRILEFVKRLEGLSWDKAITISMMYPTITI